MKNKALWKPSKYVMTERGLRGSRDPAEVYVGSRLMADITAKTYEKTIREHARGLLLDLGCGKVPLYETYRDLTTESICVDWNQSTQKSPHIDYEVDLNAPIPLPDAQFDTILATDLVEHIWNPDLLWREMARLLKTGGKLILGTPFYYWIHEEPNDFYRYTEYGLRRFCDDNRLEILSLDPYGGAPEIVLDILAKLFTFSRTLSRIHVFMSTALLNSPPGRKLSGKTSKRFPIGYCLVAQKMSR